MVENPYNDNDNDNHDDDAYASKTAQVAQLTQVYDADKAQQAEAVAMEAERRRAAAMRRRNEQRQQQKSSSSSSTHSLQQQNQAKNLDTVHRDDPEWKFFDTARIHVRGGDGGSGCVAFRREKGEPRGGPSGGRGGRGGNVYLVCDETINTLMNCRQRVHVRAEKGKNGLGKSQDGQAGHDIWIPVPPGTVLRDLRTQQWAGELREHNQRLLVAKGGRGGRGNAAFMTSRRTSPKLAERGEPGAAHWLSLELRLIADVGFLGKPNAGKSTLLKAASNAKPKIANYPFTTVVPNLGICNVDDLGATAMVLCDIPGLIEGAATGAGMGGAFLRHVQRCRVLLHVLDGSAPDPVHDFHTINRELELYDPFLAEKPQVVIVNKIDIPQVRNRLGSTGGGESTTTTSDHGDDDVADDLLERLRQAAGHSRVMPISAATREGVTELMRRIYKFVQAQPEAELPPPLPTEMIDLSKAGLDYDSDDFTIVSDPSYPGQWRVKGQHIEQLAKMTHWEYPEAVERFGRQLQAMGISEQLIQRGAEEGDLIMIDVYDFEFSPGLTNPYIPPSLLQQDEEAFFFGPTGSTSQATDKNRKVATKNDKEETEEQQWRPFPQGGFLDVDVEELEGFGEMEDWELLEEAEFENDDEDEYLPFEPQQGDEMWTSQ